jgi:hypothetical protein
MKKLIFPAILLFLLPTAPPCNADNSASKPDCVACDKSAPTADPSDSIVDQLYNVAKCTPDCCQGKPCSGDRALAARLSAIDTLGGFKTICAAKTLDCLLKSYCKSGSTTLCACDDYTKTLLALHAIQALQRIGAPASLALPEINSAVCLSDDLAGPIASAVTAIQTPAPTPKVDPATKAKLEKLIHELERAELALCHGCPCKVEEVIQHVKHEIRKLETPPAPSKP